MEIQKLSKRSARTLEKGSMQVEAVRFPADGFGAGVIDLRIRAQGDEQGDDKSHRVTLSLQELAKAMASVPLAYAPSLSEDLASWAEVTRQMSESVYGPVHQQGLFDATEPAFDAANVLDQMAQEQAEKSAATSPDSDA